MKDDLKQMIDSLASARKGGAYAIKGFSYQFLATLRELLRMVDSEFLLEVCVEGLEDFDSRSIDGWCHTQVKTSIRPWNVSDLDGVIASFLPVLDADPECRLVLLLDRRPGQDLRRLVDGPRDAAVKKLCKRKPLAPQSGRTRADAERLLDRFELEWSTEAELLDAVAEDLHRVFAVAGQHTDHVVRALLARVMEAASDRRCLTATHTKQWWADAVEAAGELAAMLDIGVLVGPAEWGATADEAVYLAGKTVTPGHIASDHDVPRPSWIERIASATEGSTICVIRSASGQGKTTLALRYAYDHWPHEATYLLRSCTTPEQAEKVRRWVEFRARLRLPTLLICEGDAAVRRWPLVAQRCDEVGLPMVVAVRREDWARYAEEGRFNYEVVDPMLTPEEARSLAVTLRKANRQHADAPPPEQAYERAGRDGERPLLMEYVYLLTQGRTLRERLRDQVRQVTRLGEDPARLQLTRLTVAAHTLGVHLDPVRLSGVVSFRDDPDAALEAIDGEFVRIAEGRLTGLHHVRSEILHELLNGPMTSQTDTALSVLSILEEDQLAVFASAALSNPKLQPEQVLDALAARPVEGEAHELLAILNGCFEAGERQFLLSNAASFDALAEEGGASPTTLLATDLMPFARVNFFQELAEILPGDEGPKRLLERLRTIDDGMPRGVDLCRRLLDRIDADALRSRLDDARRGWLLDWLFLVGVKPLDPEGWFSDIWPDNALELPIETLCALSQGVGRTAPEAHRTWVKEHEADVVGAFMLLLDCTRVRFQWAENPPAVEAEFHLEGEQDRHGETMERIDRLRRLLPHFGRFAARVDWSLSPLWDALPEEVLSIDSVKNMKAAASTAPSDVEKNVIFRRLVEARFAIDTYYDFEHRWFRLRAAAIEWGGEVDQILQNWLGYESEKNADAAVRHDPVADRLVEALRSRPTKPPPQAPLVVHTRFNPSTRQKLGVGQWVESLTNLQHQWTNLVDKSKDVQAARLAAFAAHGVVENLSALHNAFEAFAEASPRYVDFAAQAEQERVLWRSLEESALLALARRRGVPGRSADEIRWRLRHRQARVLQEREEALRNGFAARGLNVLAPPCDELPGLQDLWCGTLRDEPVTTYPVVFEVLDPIAWESEQLPDLLEELRLHGGLAESFALVPMHAGQPAMGELCLTIATFRLSGTGNPVLLPGPVPDEVRHLMPHPGGGTPPAVAKAIALAQALTLQTGAIDRVREAAEATPAAGRFTNAVRLRWDERIEKLQMDLNPIATELQTLLPHLEPALAAEAEDLLQGVTSN